MPLGINNSFWISKSTSCLKKEIAEQILPDGSHFELSPMYHAQILLDLLDIVNLSRAYPSYISKSFLKIIETCIPGMLQVLENMSHPDKGVSFFNDSVNGIAPEKSKIEDYAKALCFEPEAMRINQIKIFRQDNSGYISAVNQGSKLIFDAAGIGASYIPGHGHADTLSLELSYI